MKKTRHRYSGFICQAGMCNPQVQVQLTPLCWGLSVGWGSRKIACQLGPVAIAIWFTFCGLKAECRKL